jgi:glycosyltransferase involved in cell wall biosynthesis
VPLGVEVIYMDNMLVSVVIPAYNAECFIGETIRSVLKQTYPNFEVIIVDDGSTDGTAEVVKSFDDVRIKYFYQKNASQAVARNAGINHAQGSFVAFLDNDDIWLPEKLEDQLRLFEGGKAGVVFTEIEQIDKNGIPVENAKTFALHRGNIFRILLDHNFIAVSSVMIKTQLIRNNKLFFRTGRQGTEDWDLWIRLAKISEFDFVPKPLVKYRVYEESLSQKKIDLMYSSAIRTLTDVTDELTPGEKTQVAGALSSGYFYLALRYGHCLLSQNRRVEARKIFLKAFQINPLSIRPAWGMLKCMIR